MRILALLLLALLSAPALAEGSITIGFIGQDRPPVRPVWPLNRELRDKGLNVPGRTQVRALSARHAPDHVTHVIRHQQRSIGADRYANRPAV